jgi:hypothetical protein
MKRLVDNTEALATMPTWTIEDRPKEYYSCQGRFL